MKGVSLRLRIIALVLLITVSACIIVGITSYMDAKKSILQSLQDNAATRVQNQAENLSEWIHTRLAMVEVMSRTQQIRFGTDEERLAYFRNEVESSDSVFATIGFADLNGRLPLITGETIQIEEEPTFKQVLEGHYEISDPFKRQGSDKLLFTLQVPVYGGNDKIIGLVDAAIWLETEIGLNLHFKLGQADSIILFNKSGQKAYPSDVSPAQAGISGDLIQHDKGSIQLVDNGSESILFYAKVPNASWHIGLQIPLKELEAPLDALFTKMVITILLAVAVMAWLLFVLLNRQIARIRQLVAVTETVAAGNFNVPSIEFAGRDELGALAESFNVMNIRLRDMFQRLEVMINQNGFAMMSLDDHYVVNYFSKAAEKLLGYTNEEVIGNATPFRFIPKDEFERVAAELSLQLGREVKPDLLVFDELRNFHDSYEMEWVFVRKDGTRISVMHNSSAVRDINGKLTGIVVITRDITQQKQAQADLLLAKQEAEEANLAKGEFVARMSHEIRTPLSGIIGLTQLMQKSTMNDIQKDYMDKMLKSSRAMLNIINEILDFSKVEAGKLQLESISFSPENLLNKIADMIGVFLMEKDQFDVIVEVADSVPHSLVGDPTRLEQILLNLCSNAVKFTETGHVSLKMQALHSHGSEIEVRFTVEDTGIGMSLEQIDRIFTPYAQADDSTSRKYGGTGLGLFISKSLIEMMGGNLQVDSEPGKGSRFFFTLRLQVPHLSTNDRLLMKEELRFNSIWLVEDSSKMRTHLSRVITSFGLQSVGFAAWKDALRSLQGGAASAGTVILLDMEALDMFGPETFHELKQAASEREVLTLAMTSAYGREELNRMALTARPDGILVKPISRINLFRALAAILEGKERHVSHTDIPANPVSAPTSNGKILLAEDHEINRQVAISLLESHGFEVQVAINGYEVLSMLEFGDWDLVLMDIQMPDMDGKETTRRIRRNPRFANLPIIAMTAHAMPKEQEAFVQSGMNATLTKPIEERALLAAIYSWMAKSPRVRREAAAAADTYTGEIPVFLQNLSGVQVGEALTRLNGKVSIFMQMLQTFQRDFADYDEKMRKAYEQGELKEMKRLLHSLRGVAGTLSAGELFMAVGYLEDAFDAGTEDEAEWDRLFAEVTRSLRIILASLEQLN